MFVSRIDPSAGTIAGILSAVGVYAIYNNALPTTTDIRTVAPNDDDVDAARKTAAYESAALLGVMFLVTKNLDAFIIGGAAMIGIDLMHRHANAVNPGTGRVDVSSSARSIATMTEPLPDYGATGDAA